MVVDTTIDILEALIKSIEDDASVREVRRGLYWTAVVSRLCGLASTMMRDACQDEEADGTMVTPFTERSALQLAQLALSCDIGAAPVGLAALNSLIEVDMSRCVEINGGDLLLQEGQGRKVAVVGHFPFTDDLHKVTKNLWVIEKWPRAGDYPKGDAEEYLPQSDIIAISSTTLINHTLSGLLKLCPQKSLKILLGPTTPMAEVLFDYGIDVVSGSTVTDEERALKYISEGANFRQLKRTGSIRLITMMKNRTSKVGGG
jgi:hypothetical protein